MRKQIALVTQDTFLFDDTIFNNIAYGLRHTQPKRLSRPPAAPLRHGFITALPLGYQTRVGEAGLKLSGGQKQHLALARAILRNPAILILDEFTSQNDTESEADIHRALKQFKRRRRTLHHPSAQHPGDRRSHRRHGEGAHHRHGHTPRATGDLSDLCAAAQGAAPASCVPEPMRMPVAPPCRRFLAGLLLLAVGLFFWRTSKRNLWSSHEGRAAMNASSLLAADSQGLPRLYDGRLELQKPPLYYWLVAAAGWCSGGVDALAVDSSRRPCQRRASSPW